MKKILLLTDIPPTKDYTAGLVLDQLCRFLDKGEIACFNILNEELNAKISPDLDWIPIEYCKRPFEAGGTLLAGSLGVASSLVVETFNVHFKTKKIIKRAVTFGKEFGADIVWCVIQGQTMVRVAGPIAQGIGAPLLLQVWDPLEWWLRAHKVNAWSSSKLLRQFEETMKHCQGCFAASWAMAEEYNRDYGVRAIDFIPSLSASYAKAPAKSITSEAELVFAMAGQLYAIDEWNAFLSLHNSLNWKIKGRTIKILLLGKHDGLEIPSWAAGKVHKVGWVSQEEAVSICNSADILYCPYWFSPDFEKEARLSFPSKLTTYLASGRPVLFHGPEYASPARYLKKYDAGYFCCSNAEDELLKCIVDIIDDPERYARIAQNGSRVFSEQMTLPNMKRRFEEFIQR